MKLLPLHVFFMATAFVSMLAGISSAKFLKTKKWWLKAHKVLNLVAVAALLFGLTTAAFMVQSAGGPHFRVPHAFMGAFAALFALGIPALGFSMLKAKGKTRIAGMRRAHRYAGRAAAVFLAAAATSGLFLIGVL